MKKTLPFKTIKKSLWWTRRPDLYLILRFLCVPLEEAHVPLVVRVPHFENHWYTGNSGNCQANFGLMFDMRQNKPSKKKAHDTLRFPEVPFQCLQIDYSYMPAVGNLKCMLTIVDRFSKWPDVLPAVLAEMRMILSSTTKYLQWG